MLIDVETEEGVFLAKVLDEDETTYEVRLLVYRRDSGLYRYGKPLVIEKESVTGFYNPEDTEIAAGFKKVDGGFMVLEEESDDDYTPSSDGEESASDSDEGDSE